MDDSRMGRSRSTGSFVLSGRPKQSHRLQTAESVIFEAATAFDSLVTHSADPSPGPPSSPPPPQRSKSTRRTRESDLFAAANSFDSIAQSAAKPVILPPISASSPFQKFLNARAHHSVPAADAHAILSERFQTVTLECTSLTHRIRATRDALRGLSRQITENTRLSADQMRCHLRFQIAAQTHRLDFFESEQSGIKENLLAIANFREFLEKHAAQNAIVDVHRFFGTLRLVPSDATQFEREEARLKACVQRTLKIPKPNPDPLAHFEDPESRTGQILTRLQNEITRVMYADLETVAEALLEGLRDKALFNAVTIVDYLFDFGWAVRPFPFCPTFSPFRIPKTADILPKIFAPDFLDEEWQFMPLGRLTSRDWPLRTAIDLLFPVVITTNPFAIADHFYAVIEEIGRCVQRLLIRSGKSTAFVEIDFDQMFVLMVICVLASGLSDILAPMRYSYSFAEFVRTDPCRQYAMSHMEGLCTHLAQLDYGALRKRSIALLETYASEHPLA
jgi:hypothetical protein